MTMMTKEAKIKKGLGKGLNKLLSEVAKAGLEMEPVSAKKEGLLHLPVSVLHRGKYQPRREFDPVALQELADSIRAQGIIQPIVVRSISADIYEIIAGERRFRAAQMAGLTEIPVVVRDISDAATMAMALIENIQREDLNPIEEAEALQRLINECGLTHQALAETVGKSRTAITNTLRLLQLAEPVKLLLQKNAIEMGHARALLSLPLEKQIVAAHQIVEKKWSVREIESWVREQLNPPEIKTIIEDTIATDPNIIALERQLSDKLGARVSIHPQVSGGKVVIRYFSLEELEGMLDKIR